MLKLITALTLAIAGLQANSCYILVKRYKTLPVNEREAFVAGAHDALKAQIESMNNPKTARFLDCLKQGSSMDWTKAVDTFVSQHRSFQRHAVSDFCAVDIFEQVAFERCVR